MFRILTVWLWVCSLLASTIGVSVAHIYCYCKGEGAVAFSLPLSLDAEGEDDCSTLGHETTSCCSKPSADAFAVESISCCARVDAPTCCAADDDGWQSASHTCTSKTVKIYQLKLDLHGPLSWDHLPDLPLWADEAPVFRKWFCPVLCWQQPLNKAPPEAPPPLSGRQICIRHEVFRC